MYSCDFPPLAFVTEQERACADFDLCIQSILAHSQRAPPTICYLDRLWPLWHSSPSTPPKHIHPYCRLVVNLFAEDWEDIIACHLKGLARWQIPTGHCFTQCIFSLLCDLYIVILEQWDSLFSFTPRLFIAFVWTSGRNVFIFCISECGKTNEAAKALLHVVLCILFYLIILLYWTVMIAKTHRIMLTTLHYWQAQKSYPNP